MKIQSVLEKVIRLLSSTLPRNIEIRQDVDPNCSAINADVTQIHQIIMNLATNAYHAMDAFSGSPGEFDLVITDMSMPRMSGDILASKLLGVRPDIPIVLCTGSSENITPETAKQTGIKAVLMKPVLLYELSQKIRQVLDESMNTDNG